VSGSAVAASRRRNAAFKLEYAVQTSSSIRSRASLTCASTLRISASACASALDEFHACIDHSLKRYLRPNGTASSTSAKVESRAVRSGLSGK
jgi:hypothetical protein